MGLYQWGRDYPYPSIQKHVDDYNLKLKKLVECMKLKGTKVILYLQPVTQHFSSAKMTKEGDNHFNVISRQYMKGERELAKPSGKQRPRTKNQTKF